MGYPERLWIILIIFVLNETTTTAKDLRQAANAGNEIVKSQEEPLDKGVINTDESPDGFQQNAGTEERNEDLQGNDTLNDEQENQDDKADNDDEDEYEDNEEMDYDDDDDYESSGDEMDHEESSTTVEEEYVGEGTTEMMSPDEEQEDLEYEDDIDDTEMEGNETMEYKDEDKSIETESDEDIDESVNDQEDLNKTENDQEVIDESENDNEDTNETISKETETNYEISNEVDQSKARGDESEEDNNGTEDLDQTISNKPSVEGRNTADEVMDNPDGKDYRRYKREASEKSKAPHHSNISGKGNGYRTDVSAFRLPRMASPGSEALPPDDPMKVLMAEKNMRRNSRKIMTKSDKAASDRTDLMVNENMVDYDYGNSEKESHAVDDEVIDLDRITTQDPLVVAVEKGGGGFIAMDKDKAEVFLNEAAEKADETGTTPDQLEQMIDEDLAKFQTVKANASVNISEEEVVIDDIRQKLGSELDKEKGKVNETTTMNKTNYSSTSNDTLRSNIKTSANQSISTTNSTVRVTGISTGQSSNATKSTTTETTTSLVNMTTTASTTTKPTTSPVNTTTESTTTKPTTLPVNTTTESTTVKATTTKTTSTTTQTTTSTAKSTTKTKAEKGKSFKIPLGSTEGPRMANIKMKNNGRRLEMGFELVIAFVIVAMIGFN